MCCSSESSSFRSESSDLPGRELLFGEIDSTGTQSLRSNKSTCNITLSSSSTFLKFWLCDEVRDQFLSYVDKDDLSSLRLACHDFSGRVAPFLFQKISPTFKAATFSRPSRIAALERIGEHVRDVSITFPSSTAAVLPPLIDPASGEELPFIYNPQLRSPDTLLGKVRHPKYGSWEVTDLLVKQYPPLFHAATNVPAFVRFFRAIPFIQSLTISCQGLDSKQHSRRKVVDYALISLRIAMEHASLPSFKRLAFTPIHSSSLLYLQPMFSFGASPRAGKLWSQVEDLTMVLIHDDHSPKGSIDALKILHNYLRNFLSSLTRFSFKWASAKGPFPLSLHTEPSLLPQPTNERGSTAPCMQRLKFRKLQYMELTNAEMDANQISAFISRHRRTLNEFNFADARLRTGTWDDALAPLSRMSGNDDWKKNQIEVMEVPLILSPSYRMPTAPNNADFGDSAFNKTQPALCRWLHRAYASRVSFRAKEQIIGGSEHLKKFLRSSVLPWR